MTPLTHINGESHVAKEYGLEEAIFLHSLMFWYRTNRGNEQNFYDGRWWTYNSVKAFEAIFPWWNSGQIRRIIARCREKGAILVGHYNKDQRDRTAWYTPSDALLELYGETENCNCRKRQMEVPESPESFDENGEPLPCSNHVGTENTPYSPPQGDTPPAGSDGVDKPQPAQKRKRSRRKKSVPDHAPERFEQFWAAYPGGGSRLKAVEEWDKLAPSEELMDEMALALKRQMRSRMWREGIGIPHACRWLRDRRWTDKLPEEPQAEASPGGSTRRWDPLPEVDG